MIEKIYEVNRNSEVVDGLYGFIMTDQIGVVLHESENMGHPQAKLIMATRLLVSMFCPENLESLDIDYIPSHGSVLHEDATKLCVGDESCLPEVQKAVFSCVRYLPESTH